MNNRSYQTNKRQKNGRVVKKVPAQMELIEQKKILQTFKTEIEKLKTNVVRREKYFTHTKREIHLFIQQKSIENWKMLGSKMLRALSKRERRAGGVWA